MRDRDHKGTAVQEAAPAHMRSRATAPGDSSHRARRVAFFGHFGLNEFGNFGNEITLQAFIFNIRRFFSQIELSCICTDPVTTAKTYNITGVPISRPFLEDWKPRHRLARALRSVLIGGPSELYRWVEALRTLKHTDALIIPGTGLLMDAYGLRSWGPYNLFKWSLIAKMCGCKLFFVSVGAGPIDSSLGRWLVKSALALADFRSYRDHASKDYLRSIGAAVADDPVYPDLAFSIVDEIAPASPASKRRRPLIGIGLLLHHGRLSSDNQREATYIAYVEQLAEFAKWLLVRGYDIRLLIGDLSDRSVVADLKALLKNRLAREEDRILDDPVLCVDDLLRQIAETDAVVATRFHNVLLALALKKPVISISFHQKCTALMEGMGLEEFCQDIRQLNADKLIEQFRQLEKNAPMLRRSIGDKVAKNREALDEQYHLIFNDLRGIGSSQEFSRARRNRQIENRLKRSSTNKDLKYL